MDKFFKHFNKKTKLLVLLSALGLLIILSIAFLVPFKDKLLSSLYPKPKLGAAVKPLTAPCEVDKVYPNNTLSYRHGYVGPDSEAISYLLHTPLRIQYDYFWDSHKGPGVYMVGSGSYPFGLQITTPDYLDNNNFTDGLNHWSSCDSADWSCVDNNPIPNRVVAETKDGKTTVKVTAGSGTYGTQTGQRVKLSAVSGGQLQAGQWLLFGVWVYTATPDKVSIFFQDDVHNYRAIGVYDTNITPLPANTWTFVIGYGQVTTTTNQVDLVFRVWGPAGNTAWFSNASTLVIDPSNTPSSYPIDNSRISSTLITDSCTDSSGASRDRRGAAWLIENEPNWGDDASFKRPSPTLYALLFHHYYNMIKKADGAAQVIMGGLATPDPGSSSYPLTWMPLWVSAYQNMFSTTPPTDAVNVHYYETQNLTSSSGLETYMTNLRNYINTVSGWGTSKPIWVTEYGVISNQGHAVDPYYATNGAAFARNTTNFLRNNTLNIAKWFFYHACTYENRDSAYLIPLIFRNFHDGRMFPIVSAYLGFDVNGNWVDQCTNLSLSDLTLSDAGTAYVNSINTLSESAYSASWQTDPNWGNCTKSCGGGTQSRNVWCQRNDGVRTSDSNCTGTKPATSQSCNTQACPTPTPRPTPRPAPTPPPVSQTISLQKGWNLIGLIVGKPDYKARDFVADLNTGEKITGSVYRWNQNMWESFILNPVTTQAVPIIRGFDITPGVGYWILSNRNTTRTLTGAQASLSSLTLDPGWNLISLPTVSTLINTASLLAQELTRQGFTVSQLTSWSNGRWVSFLPSFPTSGFNITAGLGYFVNLTAWPSDRLFILPSSVSSSSVQGKPAQGISPQALPNQSSSLPCTPYTTDIDKNNTVTSKDLDRWNICSGKKITDKDKYGNSCKLADTNGDSKIDKSDYDCIRANIGKSYKLIKATKNAGPLPKNP